MSKTVVAIPSYNRYDILPTKSLETLKRGGIPTSDIYIFVVDAEKELYAKTCPGYTIVVGKKGLVAQREFIQDFFELNTYIVFMDDDIERIYTPIDTKTKNTIHDLHSLFSLMRIRMHSEKVSICGIYPVDNCKFALGNKEHTTDLRFLVGCFYMIKNIRTIHLTQSEEEMEDKIRTIKYYESEHKTLRFNHVCVKTKWFSKGGMYSDTRLKEHEVAAKNLVEEYPHYLRLQKVGKIMDARFKKIKNLEKISKPE